MARGYFRTNKKDGSQSRDREAGHTVTISALINHETPKAYLLSDGVKESWVPKSLTKNNNDGTFTMPSWVADRFEAAEEKPRQNIQPSNTLLETVRDRVVPAALSLSWHHIHQRLAKITGSMALKNNKATVEDFKEWAAELRAIAEGMDANVNSQGVP